MKPRLLNLAAGVSLLLAIAIVALWVRSYWWSVYAIRVTTAVEEAHEVSRAWQLTASRGGIRVALLEMSSSAPAQANFSSSRGWKWFQGPPQMELGSLPRFMHEATTMPQPGHAYFLVCPFWLMIIGLAILPTIAIVRHRRRRRRETNNLCPTCGYDLRATPDRCPECGAVPVGSAVS